MKMVFSANKKKSGQPNNIVNVNDIVTNNLSYSPSLFFQTKILYKVVNNSDCITCKNVK